MVDCFPHAIPTANLMSNSIQEIIGNNVQLILISKPSVVQEQPKTIETVTSDDPLDLSLKPIGHSHDLLRRSSSSSSASSSDSGFLSSASSEFLLLSSAEARDDDGDVEIPDADLTEDQLEEKRLKRREQNKAAAQAYRQRKKSFSELVEGEYDILLRRNAELLGRKAKLENQIVKIRELLDHVVQASKQQEEEEALKPEVLSVDHVRVRSESAPDVETPIFSSGGLSITIVRPSLDQQGIISPDIKESGRSRQYSWPSDGSTCPMNNGNNCNRKKEQNRIASQRFRERRRQAMSRCQIEADYYEASNVQLRQRCDQLQRKINALKRFFQQRHLVVPDVTDPPVSNI